MKTKVLLAALSLPLVFTACSQDEWMDDVQPSGNIKAEGYKVTLNVTKGVEGESGANTRASWADKIVFEKNDKISVFWLGETDGSSDTYKTASGRTSLKGKFNSIFRTEDGEAFTSESMVFKGGNIAVFPAQTDFSSEGNVVLKVAANQDASTLKAVPYISNQLWIEKQQDGQSAQIPGYYGDGGVAELDAPVKLAANVVNLTMNLTNIPQGYDFKVQSVELVAEPATSDQKVAFATEADVTTIATKPAYKGEVRYDGNANHKVETIVAQTWIAAKSDKKVNSIRTTALEGAETATVTAKFVILPTEVGADAIKNSGSKIVIRTNCGTITIEDPAEGAVPTPIAKASDAGTTYTIKGAIVDFASVAASKNEKFENEKIGYIKDRVINVDASKAVLSGSEVYSDADIRRYISLYGAMGKTDNMQLVLSSEKTGDDLPATFEGLTKATVGQVDGNSKFSLVAKNGTVNAVEIVGGGEVISIKNIVKAVEGQRVALVLGEGTWAMNDTFKLFETEVTTNPLSGITNCGTLTIRGTKKSGVQNKVATSIYNVGTLKLGGNNIVKFGTLATRSGSVIDIESAQELQFASDVNTGSLYGTINVKIGGFLTVANNVTAVNNGTINNYGTIASSGAAGGLTNAVCVLDTDNRYNSPAAINVMADAAITYVQDNAAGNIYLKNRNDEVRVESANKGNIVYNYKYATDGATFKQYASDKFTVVDFGSDATAITLHKSVYNEAGTEITDGTVLPTETTVRFAGTTKLTSNNITLKRLEVVAGGNVQFTTGNVLTVSTLKNAGTITIGGTIYYTTYGGYTAGGRVLSVGGGAIVWKGIETEVNGGFNITKNKTYVLNGDNLAIGAVSAGVAGVLKKGTGNGSATIASTVAIPGNSKVVVGTGVILTVQNTTETVYNTYAAPTTVGGLTQSIKNAVVAGVNAGRFDENGGSVKVTCTVTFQGGERKKITADWENGAWVFETNPEAV